MAAGSTQDSIRKVLGAIKDSTKVGLAQINSEYKELDIAIVKATNHVECVPKEKHVRTIFAATSATRPRADVAYCIHALARRVSKTHNWTVALKSLMVIHRTLREGDPTFREELVNYSRSRRLAFNLSNFRDDSSPNAWDYSSWVRAYALYLEERLDCFRTLKYDLESDQFLRTKELNTVDLLEHLPALQQLLQRLMGCQPEGAVYSNSLIQCALNLILKESIRIYHAINDGMINLVDKFFEMQRHDAVNALEIYKRGGHQAEKLVDFYDECEGLDFSRSTKFPILEQPPQSFLASMEQYVRNTTPRQQSSLSRKGSLEDDKTKKMLVVDYKLTVPEEPLPTPAESPAEDVPSSADPLSALSPRTVDLLGLDNTQEGSSVIEEHNAVALAIVPTTSGTTAETSKGLDMAGGVTGWELALATTASSNDSAVNKNKLVRFLESSLHARVYFSVGANAILYYILIDSGWKAGGFDRLVLDSLYEDALTRQATPNQIASHAYHPQMVAMFPGLQQDPFLASSKVASPSNMQLEVLAQQQQAMMMHQQMMAGGVAMNPNGYSVPYMMPIANQYQGHMQSNPFATPGFIQGPRPK